jgi:hypothetical protein
MRILITGSRTWDDYDTLSTEITKAIIDWVQDHPGLDKGPIDWVTIIHGNNPRGADFLADRFATDVLGVKVERYDADWSQFGKFAGIKRNMLMVDKGADVCLAFIRQKSKGATHCRDYAKRKGIPTETFYYDAEKLAARDRGEDV